jgi:hypothetical protein
MLLLLRRKLKNAEIIVFWDGMWSGRFVTNIPENKRAYSRTLLNIIVKKI